MPAFLSGELPARVPLLGELELRRVLGAVLKFEDEFMTDARLSLIRLPVADVLASVSVVVQVAGADGYGLLYGICRKPCVAANFPEYRVANVEGIQSEVAPRPNFTGTPCPAFTVFSTEPETGGEKPPPLPLPKS